MKKLFDWMLENGIDFQKIDEFRFKIEGIGTFYYLKERKKGEKVFADGLTFDFQEEDISEMELVKDFDYIAYQFGQKYFYSKEFEKVKLKELKYLGKVKTEITSCGFPLLGIHSGYELCNGASLYTEWCKKAKFLGVDTLGICEEGNLGGVVQFQFACRDAGIKPIFGETIKVRFKGDGEYYLKIYVRNKAGWKRLLKIHEEVTIKNAEWGGIEEHKLLELLNENLIVVFSPHQKLSQIWNNWKNQNVLKYYALDFTEWSSGGKDREVLENLQEYLLKFKGEIPSVLIQDMYYLDKGDWEVRKFLNITGNHNFKNMSRELYMKNMDEIFLEAMELVKENDEGKMWDILIDSIERTFIMSSQIDDFNVVEKEFFLPKYEQTETEIERVRGGDNESLLKWYLMRGMERLREKGLMEGISEEEYEKRWSYEVEIIKMGGFIDYFLILNDMYRFARGGDIWYGIGRGSAAGSLVSYLLGITGVNPIKYELFFERFLNPGRIGKSLPDIDADFQATCRGDIKKYMERRYGIEQIVSISAYGSFRLKNSLKDLGRYYGVDVKKMNYVTSFLDEIKMSYTELFSLAQKNPSLKEFLQSQEGSKILEMLPKILGQPKNASIHAAGIILAPKEFGKACEQFPVKIMDGALVSEWDGFTTDEAGFLKVDILGIQQMDKFAEMSRLVRNRTGKYVRFEDISLDDKRVFEYFSNGWNEDVFQLGGGGLKAYSKELVPETIEDIIATVALYRPGPIDSGTHKKYQLIKNGFELPSPAKGTEEITKKTYGLIIYQEQTMAICRAIGDFTLTQADDVRKALGKMKASLIQPYRILFLERAVEKGYDKVEMEELWLKMERFAGYAFNRSHACCYAITGYYSQWFKVNYPIEFWVTSLKWSSNDQISARVSEINKSTNIKIVLVDINNSNREFSHNFEKNSIYWSLVNVKWVGEKAVEAILKEREENGMFFSFEEFFERLKERKIKVDKRAITNLIIAGAFDEIEDVKDDVRSRYYILDKFWEISRIKEKDIKEEEKGMLRWEEWQWQMKQKDLVGFTFFNYKKIIQGTHLKNLVGRLYEINVLIEETDVKKKEYKLAGGVMIAGIVEEFFERQSKNGRFGQLKIVDNTDEIFVTVWSDSFSGKEDELRQSVGKIVCVTGTLVKDSYKSKNVLHTNEKTKIIIF
jgi:DNA polymerase-3 subunit alpha